MTTNRLNQMKIQLNRAEKKDSNIRITVSMGTTVEFLDVTVTNHQGQLKTTVYHKPAAEPYILPFLSEHPRHVHSNTIKGALFRAARLCSTVEDFDDERRRIEMTLLLNGYPVRFITYHFKQFFRAHDAFVLLEELDKRIYEFLHQKLLNQPSRREREQQNDQTKPMNNKVITVHFTFDTGPMVQFRKELRRLWEKHYIYKGSPMNAVALSIRPRTNKSLCQLLVKKKPAQEILRNINTTNTRSN
jgi:hypothetical protein